MAELPELLVSDAAAWRAWLTEHHTTNPGVRLVLHKKGGHVTELNYAAALQEALCFGWIDGVGGKRDDGSHLRRFTPRTKASKWSKINVGHYERLVAGLRPPTPPSPTAAGRPPTLGKPVPRSRRIWPPQLLPARRPRPCLRS